MGFCIDLYDSLCIWYKALLDICIANILPYSVQVSVLPVKILFRVSLILCKVLIVLIVSY